MHYVSKNMVSNFAITSSTVKWFWKFCYCCKQQWIIYLQKKYNIFAASWKPHCTMWNV